LLYFQWFLALLVADCCDLSIADKFQFFASSFSVTCEFLKLSVWEGEALHGDFLLAENRSSGRAYILATQESGVFNQTT